MEIFSDCDAFQIIPFAGRINFPKHSLTILVKATFDISHKNVAKIAGEQLPPAADEYYPDDETQSGTIYYPSDFAYFKPNADILLSGTCHVPNGKTTTACPVSIQVGNYKKILSVFGSRYWKKILFSPESTTPEPFTSMDLRYERSFGGDDYIENPIGRGAIKSDISVADNVLPVPNIQDPNNAITSPHDKTPPAGFSPLSATWSFRHKKLGTYDNKYLKQRWPWYPDDFDWSHFNAAPQDQQIKGYLRGDENLVFENLHPRFSNYQTQLPGIRPRCFTRKQDPKTKKRYFDEVNLKLDTLWVDTEKEKLVLVWRGWTEILDEDFDEVKQIFVKQESMADKSADIAACYEAFKKAQAAEEAEFSPPEIPEVSENSKKPLSIAKPGLSVAGTAMAVEATASPEELQKAALSEEIDRQLEELGISDASLSAQAKENVHEQLSTDSTKKIVEIEGQLKETMDTLGLDIEKLPELTAKEQQEKNRFFEALGFGSEDVADNPSIDKIWMVMAASLPNMGMSAENLSPLIEQNAEVFNTIKAEVKLIKDNASPNPSESDKSKLQTESDTKVEPVAGASYAGLDLSGVDFSGADLTGADFSYSILHSANFNGCQLTGANFEYANAVKANFQAACLDSANLNGIDAKEAILTNCVLIRASVTDANFESVNANSSNWKEVKGKDAIFVNSSLNDVCFALADLPGADFEGAALQNADFSAANLHSATFERVSAEKSIYFKANVTGLRASQSADFSGANFSQSTGHSAIFQMANISGADFSYCDMPGVNFDRADLTAANLSASNLVQARFIKANLSQTKMIKANLMQSTFERANLCQADIRGSNCYEVEFLSAELEGLQTDLANLTATKLG